MIAGDLADIGIVVAGGLTNSVLRALSRLDLADLYGASRVPIYVLNAVYPLIPEEVRAFCAGKRAVLIVEEGSPDYIEQQINVELRRADIQTRVIGKGPLPATGEYTSDVLLNGLAGFFSEVRPAGIDADAIAARVKDMLAHRPAAADVRRRAAAAAADLLHRLPGAASVLRHQADATRAWRRRTSAPTSAATHSRPLRRSRWATPSSATACRSRRAAAVAPNLEKRPIAVMGDGGFWHNGLITGVASNLFNKGDGVLIVMQNGYASATGQQFLPSSAASRHGAALRAWTLSGRCDRSASPGCARCAPTACRRWSRR